MKTLFIALLLVMNTAIYQAVEKKEAIFDGFDDGTFFFVDDEGYTWEFEQIDDKVLKKYELRSDNLKGKRFEVSYISESDIEDEDEEITTNKIVGLKLLD